MMNKITPFLWFDGRAEEAARFYTSIFKNSRIDSLSPMSATFHLDGQKFTAGGEPGHCGWLKDKFGVSWQIIPSVLGDMLQDEDEEKSQRAMQAMLQMDKLDINELTRAYEGR